MSAKSSDTVRSPHAARHCHRSHTFNNAQRAERISGILYFTKIPKIFSKNQKSEVWGNHAKFHDFQILENNVNEGPCQGHLVTATGPSIRCRNAMRNASLLESSTPENAMFNPSALMVWLNKKNGFY